jgi:hypothetical protein
MKKVTALLLAILISTAVFSQKTNFKGFEFFGTASAGLFGYNYWPKSGSQLNGPGLSLGIGGAFFVNPHWGFSTGISITNYSAFSSIKTGTNFSYSTYDSDGLPYTEKIKLDNKFTEQDILYRIEFPVMVHYRYYLPTGNALYMAGGLKVSLPMAGYYHISRGAFTTSGRYENLNATLSNLPWLGFTSYDVKGTSGMISTNKSYNASLELGYLYRLTKTTYATFSVFGDYGLNNLQHHYGASNLIYPSGQTIGIANSDVVNFTRLMSFGVKAAWHLNLTGEPLIKGKKKTYEQPQKSVEPPSFNRTKGGHQRTGN